MAISNVSSGARPGVCTSTTRPQAPYEGQLIYETDTNRVLVWDNAAWVMIADTDQPPGLQLIATTTVTSSVAYVEMLNVFSSEYDNYRIVINNAKAQNQLSYQFYLGTNATSGLHYGSMFYYQYTGASTGYANSSGANRSYIGLSDNGGENGGISFDLNAPFLTKQKTFHGTYNSRNYTGWAGGLIADSASYTGIRFICETGNWLSGTIRIYGYRN
jgi:hypothetical protein